MMRLLAILFLGANPGMGAVPCPKERLERHTPCTAPPEEQAEIMGLVDEGIAAYREYENKIAKANRLRPRVWDHKDALIVESFYEEAVEWEKKQKEAEDAKKRMQDNLDKAIQRTQLYYGIHSRYGLGPIVNGPLKDESTVWGPRFLYVSKDKDGKYEPVYRVVKVKEKKPWRVPEDKRYINKIQLDSKTNAITSEDGGVDLTIDLFRRMLEREDANPRHLARTLVHEAAHFDELISSGWTSDEKSHYQAWKAVYDAADALEMSPTEKALFRAEKEKYKRLVDLVDSGRRKPTPKGDANPEQTERAQDGLRDEYFNWVRPRLSEIERQIVELKTRLAQERQRRELGKLPEVPTLSAEEIKGLVTTACSDTPSLAQRHLGGMRNKLWFPEADGYLAGMEDGMDGCSRELWDKFMRARSVIVETGNIPAIDPAWFDDWFLRTARKTRLYHHPPMGFPSFTLLAKKACANPGSVTQEDVHDLEDTSFPNPRIGLPPSDSFSWPNMCARDLYDTLARLNNTWPRDSRLNVAWVNWRAEQLVRQHNPPETPHQPAEQQGPEPEQRNDRIDLPTLDDILRRLDKK